MAIFWVLTNVGLRVARVAFPADQARSTSIPPRARRPVTLPLGQAFGNAGNRRKTSSWLCKSISAIRRDHQNYRRSERSADRRRDECRIDWGRCCAGASGTRIPMGVFTIEQPGPKTNRPGAAPAGILRRPRLSGALATRAPRSKIRFVLRGQLAAWIERIQVRHMPLARRDLRRNLRPFLNWPNLPT